MVYNVVLVSGVQQRDSVIHRFSAFWLRSSAVIHISILFQILLPYKNLLSYRLLQNIE